MWLGQEPTLSDDCLDGLAAAFQRQHEGAFPVLLHEAQRLVAERGDDVAGWQADWEAGARLVGYRRQPPLTLLILAAFAEQPCPDPAQRPSETAMGLVLLCRLSVDCDDQARLEAAEDRTEALLTILATDREQVLPDVVERVVNLEPVVVPRLMDLLDPDEFSWGMLRAVQALERLARRHPHAHRHDPRGAERLSQRYIAPAQVTSARTPKTRWGRGTPGSGGAVGRLWDAVGSGEPGGAQADFWRGL